MDALNEFLVARVVLERSHKLSPSLAVTQVAEQVLEQRGQNPRAETATPGDGTDKKSSLGDVHPTLLRVAVSRTWHGCVTECPATPGSWPGARRRLPRSDR